MTVVLASFHSERLSDPFPLEPWQMIDTAKSQSAPMVFEAWASTGRDVPPVSIARYAMPALSGTGPTPGALMDTYLGNMIAAATTLEKYFTDNPVELPMVYGVHTKSMMARLTTRWAGLRGYNTPQLSRTQFPDLCETVNYPAILSLDERRAFSPERLAAILGLPGQQSVMQILWTTLHRFRP